ncbi:MAG: RsmD family RNA methyltransferase [Burkholderiaceae bacterium]
MTGRAGGQVRIVGGLLKRTPLPVDGDRAGLRPTPERVRATLFDWLGERVVGADCLDPFCGTGALGLEAVSRGAASVWLNDRHAAPVARLRTWLDARAQARDPRVVQALAAVRLTREDALSLMRALAARGERFDLILLDPPFALGAIEAILAAARPLLRPGGEIYLESASALTDAQANALSLALTRQGQAGRVHYHLLADDTNR